MKKVISLCAMTMLGVAAICQDTTSQRRNTTDTIPGGNNMQADTSKWNNNNRRDSTSQGQQGTWPNSNNSGNSLDTSRNRQPMEGSRDSMNRGMTPNSSSDTMYRNQNNGNSGMNRNDSSANSSNNSGRSNADSSNSGSNNTNSNNSSTGTTGNSSSTTTTTTTTTEKVTDRISMADDKIYLIENGDSSILSKEYKLSSGASVMPDGTVKYATGKTVSLKNGQFIELTKSTDKDDTEATGTKKSSTSKSKMTKKSPTKKTTTTKKKTKTTTSQNQ